MNKFEITFSLLLIIVLIGIGTLFGLFISHLKNLENYLIPIKQTKGMYIQLPNGTLWKKQ